MFSYKDFLPSSSPVSSIYAIKIEAILFLLMMNCSKSSFRDCITIIVLKIERTRNQPPYCLLQIPEKIERCRIPRSGCLGSPLSLPHSLYGRAYADVRTQIFRLNRVPKLLTHGALRAPLIFCSFQRLL